MLASVAAVLLLVAYFPQGESFSLPEQCTGVQCRDDSICIVNDNLQPECKQISTKAGTCPESVTNAQCLRLRGVPTCLLDEECPGTTKCCRGCCEEPSSLNRERETTEEKPGKCPPTVQYAAVYWWTDLFCPDTGYIDDCERDSQCPDDNKCCPGLCGKECMGPYVHVETTTTTTTTVATTTVEANATANATFPETNSTETDSNATLIFTVDEVNNTDTESNATETTTPLSPINPLLPGQDETASVDNEGHTYGVNTTEAVRDSFLNETVLFADDPQQTAGNATQNEGKTTTTLETTTSNVTDTEGL